MVEPFVVSDGEVRRSPFDLDAQLKAFEWLRQADWLDREDWIDRWQTTEDEQIALLLAAVADLGAITLSEPPPRPFVAGPRGEFVGRDGHTVSPEQVVLEAGWRKVAEPPLDPRTFIPALNFRVELGLLRKALLVAMYMSAGDDRWRAQVRDSDSPLDIKPLRFETSPVVDRTVRAVQVWFALHIGREDLRTFPVSSGGKIKLFLRPASPRQQLWLSLAVTAGVLDPPFPVPGLFTCSYQKCGRPFLSPKTGVRGSLRFCSERHGKSYYAVQATNRRRAGTTNQGGPTP